jgi:2-polyprenyl-6-methoxyphenol hydroxylase-like FAD-dependent oxidoreductase
MAMSSSVSVPLRVMVIGAGTGGLALAHGLKQLGMNVTVYERDRTARDGPGGYRVGISPAGSRALKACLPSPVYDLFVATSARAPRYFNMLTEHFAELLCLELEGEAADQSDGEKNVIRRTLRQVLLTGLDDQVVFEKKFVCYEHNADGSVTVQFEDGTAATGDVLIGADGAGSRVRKQRLPQARHEETGIVSIGGKLAMTPQSRALLSNKMFQGMSMIMAPRGFGAIIHSLEFGATRANPAFMARWPTFADSIAEDTIGWGLWAARQNFPKDPSDVESDALLRLVQDLIRGWHPNFRRLIQLTDAETLQFLNVRTSVPLDPWASSNVTLLGDAVHTMTPGRGAGANTALRDAALLCQTLSEVQHAGTPLIAAIHRYEAEMLRYSSEAVIASRKQMNAGDAIHKPVIGAIQLAGMRVVMRSINALPPLKRHIIRKIMRVRGEN